MDEKKFLRKFDTLSCINFVPIVILSTLILAFYLTFIAAVSHILPDKYIWIPFMTAVMIRTIVSIVVRIMIIKMLRSVPKEFITSVFEWIHIAKGIDTQESQYTSNVYDQLLWLLPEYIKKAGLPKEDKVVKSV